MSKYVCDVCKDSHEVWSTRRECHFQCTSCPIPCDHCRTSIIHGTAHRGAFCVNTPCVCICHRRPYGYPEGIHPPCACGDVWVAHYVVPTPRRCREYRAQAVQAPQQVKKKAKPRRLSRKLFDAITASLATSTKQVHVEVKFRPAHDEWPASATVFVCVPSEFHKYTDNTNRPGRLRLIVKTANKLAKRWEPKDGRTGWSK